jgi:hypothetical protein
MASKIKSVSFSLLKRDFNVGETMSVLKHNPSIYWSWGVSKLHNFNDKGLLFKVSGHHHKGWVLITLDWSDTFEVHLINADSSIKKTFDMVYIDSLIDTIDTAVEKIADYQY